MALTNNQKEIVSLYVAGFLRAPELGGLNYWTGMLESGKPIQSLADDIFNLPIVKDIYPDSLSNAEFVTRIYQNVFGKSPDAEGLSYWQGFLDSGLHRGSLVHSMITAGLDVPDGTPGKAYVVNRVEGAAYAAEKQLSSNTEVPYTALTTLLQTVDASPNSVTLAHQAADGLVATTGTLGSFAASVAGTTHGGMTIDATLVQEAMAELASQGSAGMVDTSSLLAALNDPDVIAAAQREMLVSFIAEEGDTLTTTSTSTENVGLTVFAVPLLSYSTMFTPVELLAEEILANANTDVVRIDSSYHGDPNNDAQLQDPAYYNVAVIHEVGDKYAALVGVPIQW